MADRPLARMSEWPRWEPKMKSSAVQMERLADGRGFLTHRQVSGAGMVVGHALVLAGGLDEVDHGLEFAQQSAYRDRC